MMNRLHRVVGLVSKTLDLQINNALLVNRSSCWLKPKSVCSTSLYQIGSKLKHTSTEEHVTMNTKIEERPKIPLSPFILYFLQEKNNYSSLKGTERAKYIAKKYKELTDEQKLPYIEEFEKNLQDFRKRLAEYKENLSVEDLRKIQMTKREKKIKKATVRKRQQALLNLKELGKPVRQARTPFNLFIKEYRHKHGTALNLVEAYKEWVKLSDDEQLVFKKNYEEYRKSYDTELLAWEEKMIELGKEDVVRKCTLEKGIKKEKRRKREK